MKYFVAEDFQGPPDEPSHAPVKCWCRRCKQDKREDEMFAGLIDRRGIGRGVCLECFAKQKAMEAP